MSSTRTFQFTPSARELVELKSRAGRLADTFDSSIWKESLHPRGRLGRWIESMSDKVGPPPRSVGATPYLKKLSADMGTPVPKTYDEAAALHKDPQWAPIFQEFEQTAEKLAKKHDVQLVAGERNVGVFEGTFEPSYTLKVHKKLLFDKTGDQRIEAFAKELGDHFRQKAVVDFTVGEGEDVELRIPQGDGDPDAFYRELVKIMGEDNAGMTFGGDEWRIFIGSFMDNPEEIVKQVTEAAKRHNMRPRAYVGTGNYHQLREGSG